MWADFLVLRFTEGPSAVLNCLLIIMSQSSQGDSSAYRRHQSAGDLKIWTEVEPPRYKDGASTLIPVFKGKFWIIQPSNKSAENLQEMRINLLEDDKHSYNETNKLKATTRARISDTTEMKVSSRWSGSHLFSALCCCSLVTGFRLLWCSSSRGIMRRLSGDHKGWGQNQLYTLSH